MRGHGIGLRRSVDRADPMRSMGGPGGGPSGGGAGRPHEGVARSGSADTITSVAERVEPPHVPRLQAELELGPRYPPFTPGGHLRAGVGIRKTPKREMHAKHKSFRLSLCFELL